MVKEQYPEQDTEFVPYDSAVPGQPKSFRLYLTLGLGGLILCQVIVLWVLLPSRNAAQEQTEFDSSPSVAQSLEPTVEIPLQKNLFRVKQFRGDETENLILRMHVVVKKKESSKFNKQYEQYTQRIIGSVEEILHASSRAERQEPGLNVLREKSKKRINEILGTPLVQQVIISEYSFSIE